MMRDPLRIHGEVLTTDKRSLPLDVLMPDRASLLGLKLHARRARQEDRDALDLWTCLELLSATGESVEFGSAVFDAIRDQLMVEFGDAGSSMRIATVGVSAAEAERRRVRIRALVQSACGTTR